ncbi:Endonuclease/exonuclease/phosphatase [Triangularia verruculosa]|uniref:Endonuclease/exonuclease/phosphatase n=1 Tax=Triangularia verruculosa TaxID=2587418 RepID=A0AAN6XG72_9PEZI|nr:Endonuclease/exonuclease/phosphatase [Triangularia verruculosa]
MTREISPPPLKRRRLAPKDAESKAQSFRVFSWNINGVGAFLPPTTAKITTFFKQTNNSEARPVSPPKTTGQRTSNLLRAFLARHNWPEVLFLQELKIKHGDSKTLAALLTAINTPLNSSDIASEGRSYTLDAVLPRDKYNARGFQGRLYGVGTIIRKDFARNHVTQIRDVDWDLEGRVNIVELKKGPAENRPLALINIYAVNGTTAPYRSPETGKVAGTRHDHKLAFHTRLRDECLELEARGYDVVVAGDLNIARGILDGHPNLRTHPAQHCINRADFNAKFFGKEDNERANAYVTVNDEDEACLDAVDVFRAIHGTERRHTYHPRTANWGSSCDRVDLILVSKCLWEDGRVLNTGLLDSPQERGPSDHVPLWVELKGPGQEIIPARRTEPPDP